MLKVHNTKKNKQKQVDVTELSEGDETVHQPRPPSAAAPDVGLDVLRLLSFPFLRR